MSPELQTAYESGKLVLFVGAGVSSALGLPTWSGLISEIAKQLEYDPEVFSTYGDSLALAEYYKLKHGSIGRLRSWMDRQWHDSSIDVNSSSIHKMIALGKFANIYTTNYDEWLERAHIAFKVPYSKIASVSDIPKAGDGVRQIVKFHGDFEDDQSIVLTETSYFERLSFETPLDIKLRAEVLGKAILFIGYSISDINIRLLFFKLTNMWKDQALNSARPKSFLFSARPNPVAKEVLGQWGIEMLSSEESDPKFALESFLGELTGV